MTKTVIRIGVIIPFALLIAACGNQNGRASYSAPAISAAPATGYPTMDDVKITALTDTKYRFETTAGPNVSMNDVLAAIYCKVSNYQTENGFEAWDVEQIQRSSSASGSGPQGILAIINLARAPVPSDFKPVEKDWCLELPAS